MSNRFTDEDLDQLAHEIHKHIYVEGIDSPTLNPATGRSHRTFRCEGCGKVRQVMITDGKQ